MTDHVPNDRLLTTLETMRLVRRGRTMFWRLLHDPDAKFPRPIPTCGNRHSFLESEVIAWLKAQPRVPITPKEPRPLPAFFNKAGQGSGKPRGARPKKRHIFYADPAHQAAKWSEDDGLICRRQSNPKEATVEAWGLVDGMPTSKHFAVRVYDDVVTLASVTSPEMIAKTTEAFQLSDNLGSVGGAIRCYGTHYSFGDTYFAMLASGALKARVYACTVDGTDSFEPENCRLMAPGVLAEAAGAGALCVQRADAAAAPGRHQHGLQARVARLHGRGAARDGARRLPAVRPGAQQEEGLRLHRGDGHRHRLRWRLPACST